MTSSLVKQDVLKMLNSYFTLHLPKMILGGGERDRTDDLLRAKQVLSQLSYTPTEFRIYHLGFRLLSLFIQILKSEFGVVGLVGIEPTTSRLSGVRSNRD